MAAPKKDILPTPAEKEKLLKLNMTFEQAMKKALNTPLPTKKAKNKS